MFYSKTYKYWDKICEILQYLKPKKCILIHFRKLQIIYFTLGLECLPTVNLPTQCFCTSGPTPTPYIPLADVLEEISVKSIPVINETNETTMDCSTGSAGNKCFIVTIVYDINVPTIGAKDVFKYSKRY